MNILSNTPADLIGGEALGDFSVQDVLLHEIAQTYPNATFTSIYDVVTHAADLVESADIFQNEGHYNDVTPLFVIASAVAVALQGRQGSKKDKGAIVRPSENAERYWDQLLNYLYPGIQQDSPVFVPPKIITQKDTLRVQLRAANRATDFEESVVRFEEDKLNGVGGLFEGFPVNLKQIYVESSDIEKQTEAFTQARKEGLKFQTGMSFMFDDGVMWLEKAVFENILGGGEKAQISRGSIVHELAHSHMQTLELYKHNGRMKRAHFLSEMMAEYARRKAGYPSFSYRPEWQVLEAIDWALGYEVLGEVIQDYVFEKDLMVNFRNRLVQGVGIVVGGLIMGSQPANYDVTNELHGSSAPPHLSLLTRSSRGRYSALEDYGLGTKQYLEPAAG